MIPVSEPLLGEEELANVTECINTNWISSQGKFVTQFESEFAGYIGKKHGTATSNGTAALHLALAALGVGDGDEVIIPTLTFVATANAVTYTGAVPVFVDSNTRYWCIEPTFIERAITRRTKAIIPVHLYGHPCDMDTILAVAHKYNLSVVEDAAEAHGARYRGKLVGSFGDISCFSFYGNKIITAGEGGVCLTDDNVLADKMRMLRDHGMNPQRRYWHDCVGFNYRMTNLQAAVGVAQLHKIDQLIATRNKIASIYDETLQNAKITLPPRMDWANPVNWLYTVLTGNRERLAGILRDSGVDTRPMFYPIHELPPYRNGIRYYVAEELSRCGLSLPSSPTLTEDEVKYICGVINTWNDKCE